MSTLEKAIGLLQEMPEDKLEAVYMYMRFVDSQPDNNKTIPTPNESINHPMKTPPPHYWKKRQMVLKIRSSEN